ncbi:unnamed protein product [Gongylonema pulchrum]|uniref:Late endosomal/lysosomal adaptor and MAPK and MTOR activator 5 n=1 Tax=Gongylonema pulchrum TaxID=637853 RepID=A0A183DG59_9BILA|nr:unnamed protein product [Gongylonema pulchrum]
MMCITCRDDEISPKLGRGIDEAVLLAAKHAIRGVHQIILIVSADGTSRCLLNSNLFSNKLNSYQLRHSLP